MFLKKNSVKCFLNFSNIWWNVRLPVPRTSILLVSNKICVSVRSNCGLNYALSMCTSGLGYSKLNNLSINKQSGTRRLSGISDNNSIVYKGQLAPRIKRVKAVSFVGSFTGICFLPKVLSPAFASSLASAFAVITFSSFFIVFTPVILHWMCKRYVTQLEFDKESKRFKATVISLFFRSKKIEFTAGEVEVPGTPLLLTSFLVRGFPLLVDAEQFTDVDIYKHLMGYDKPINLHLDKPKGTT